MASSSTDDPAYRSHSKTAMFRMPSISTTPLRAPQMVQDNMNISSSSASSLKPPKPPDRPLVPYMRFSRKMWSKVRAENADRQLWDIGKVIGQMWREASEIDKAVYQHEYELEKIEYDKSLKAYHNSSAYQMYLAAKNRSNMSMEGNKPGSISSSSSSSYGQMGRGGGGGSGRLETGGVVIQPVDEEDSTLYGELSQKRLAAVRFERNHRLIADLFSTTAVTDSRTVISQQRIDMLKRQAQSLAVHQSKLEDELRRLDEAFNEKKRQIDECGERFAAQLKKVCEEKPQADETKFGEMVEEWSAKLLEAYEEYKQKQEGILAKQKAESEQMADQTPILYQLTCTSQPSPIPVDNSNITIDAQEEKIEENGEEREQEGDQVKENGGEEGEEDEDEGGASETD